MKYIVTIAVLALIGFGIYSYVSKPESSDISVSILPFTSLSVTANEKVVSPLTVEGEVPGTWYFEASFPVRLFDANGKELAVTPAQADGEWMTEDPVPFKVVLTFATPETDEGILVLEKDNPSGLPENADEVRIPVRFK